MEVERRIGQLVVSRNRELWFEALVDLCMGALFCLITFGVLYLLMWYYVSFVWGYQWPAPVITGTIFLASCWSAWRSVDPLEGLRNLSDTEMMLTQLAMVSPSFSYFSPRHTVSGSAVFLIGGPANLFSAFGIVLHRLPSSSSIISEAATMLSQADQGSPVQTITDPRPAVLLYRLVLIKTELSPPSHQPTIVLTQKGRDVLMGMTTN
ncbi:MAG: hypothetical protein O7G85_10245 [Planctomycetota bacterium]|nr:hypothetical protein [Planctomycetota bacterium]